MKKLAKGGLILVALMAGNAQAAIVKLDMTGKVSYGYSSSSNINSGDNAKFSFLIDTSATPAYNYSYSGSDYNYSYKEYYGNAYNSYSAKLGNYESSGFGGTNYGVAYNYSWNNSNSNYAYLYDYQYTGSEYKYLQLYSSGSNPMNTQDLASAFLSGNLVSFYLYDYSYGNGSYDYNYAYGTLDGFKLSDPSAVPVPAAIWLFGSSLIGLLGMLRRKTAPAAQIA